MVDQGILPREPVGTNATEVRKDYVRDIDARALGQRLVCAARGTLRSAAGLRHAGFAKRPGSVQISRLTTPLGTGKSCAGRSFVAAIITSTQIGRAAAAPVIPGPILCFRSKPTQTPVTTPGTYPTNQASL